MMIWHKTLCGIFLVQVLAQRVGILDKIKFHLHAYVHAHLNLHYVGFVTLAYIALNVSKRSMSPYLSSYCITLQCIACITLQKYRHSLGRDCLLIESYNDAF